MNHVLWKWGLWAVVLLVGATAGGLLLRGRAGHERPAPNGGEVPLAAAEPKADPEPPAPNGTETPKAAAEPKADPAPKTAVEPKASTASKVTEERRLFLETIGALTASHCYQTYLNVGLIADGKSKGTYSDKDAYKVLDSVLALLDTVDRKLADLGKLDLDKEDRDSLELMCKLSTLLRYQGKVLQTYWDTGRDEDAAKYESVRKDSWAAISKLLGLGK